MTDPPEYILELRYRISQEADRHDMQSLAEPEILALTEEQIDAKFEELIYDRQLVVAHAPGEDDRTVCPADGEALPCAVLRRLLTKYRPG